jgi:L-2-hydroxyglutarate oxidase
MDTADFAVLGGGIVGLATALRLQKLHPSAKITLLEKEPAPAFFVPNMMSRWKPAAS